MTAGILFLRDLSSDSNDDSMTLSNVQVEKIVTWVVDEVLSTAQTAEDFDRSQSRIQQLAQDT